MLVFVPISFVAKFLNASDTVMFILACLSIIPLAGLMGQGTEEISFYSGPKIGGFLNGTFGNATELIISFFALKEYIKTKKNYLLATMLILLVVGIYSFTTYTGAARLQIALQGYIVEAYDMGLEELVYYQEKNSKRYAPIENIEVEEGQLGFVEVDNYLGIKIGTYVGY